MCYKHVKYIFHCQKHIFARITYVYDFLKISEATNENEAFQYVKEITDFEN